MELYTTVQKEDVVSWGMYHKETPEGRKYVVFWYRYGPKDSTSELAYMISILFMNDFGMIEKKVLMRQSTLKKRRNSSFFWINWTKV